jgi:hypothetical protein
MGGLISSLFNPDLPTDVVVDFDKIASPTGPELELFNEGNELILHARSIVAVVDGYKGCADLIRRAMQNPSDEAIQLSMFEGMFPNVERIKAFYTLAKRMDDLGARLVRNFIDTHSFSPGLLKIFAELLSISLRFDRAKMMHPEIQNDFSQYRRALQKNQRHPGVPVNDIEANNVSMFIAQATPIITSLSTTLDNVQRQGKDVTRFLADFAHICCAFVMREKTQNTEHAVMALTAMTVAFILYDNISLVGVFGKGSHIDVKTCVGQIRVLPDVENRGILCDALHYSTRSFDKASDNIKRVIESR